MEREPLFPVGQVQITPEAEAVLTPAEIVIALQRHQRGDYGDITDEDIHQNQRGLANCGMIMSVYQSTSGTEYWIQTHGTRSHTTILLPGE